MYQLKLKDEDLFYCVQMMLFNIFFWKLTAILLLVSKSNPVNRRQQRHRIDHHQHSLEPPKAIIAGLSGDQQFRIKHVEL